MFRLPFLRRDTPSLKGERVTLRLPATGDYREWVALRSESRSFLEPWEPRWTVDEMDHPVWRQRIRRYRQDFSNGTSIAFFIFDAASGQLLGGITLGNIRRGVALSGHVGYWIGERHAGRGLMVDALKLLTRYSFDTLNLHRIEAACIPGNTRSVRVLEKAGFRREGLLRSYLKINGIWHDHFLYSLIVDDRPGARARD